ncbi:transcriptional regulator, AraC family [Paraglaciecola sp. T6c]|uniref:AraC family transcriptional regulator n=1 Tax=Pseudoalteromonas atlantica (strain T6c / ATCC BAA-1087) TaxID=3042615 RepID=UPI00005C552D|nr:AraC family transcriptional regulator [Paraglaciecola sp. T6c]ABG39639.1 transcriptional regulator, AraC family [Paraglaciecola sp. T6c]
MRDTFGATEPAVPTYFPSALFRWLLSEGYQADALLVDLPFTEKEFERGEVNVTFNQHKAFITRCINVTQNPRLGLAFGKHLKLTDLGLLGYAASSSASLREALQVIVDYFKLRGPLLKLTLNVSGEKAILEVFEVLNYDTIRAFMCEAALVTIRNIIKLLAGDDIVQYATVTYVKPDDWDAQLSPLAFKFNQAQHSVHFDAIHLSAPLGSVDIKTQIVIKQLCQNMLAKISQQEGLITRLSHVILRQPDQFPKLEEAAKALATSPRTLRRELQSLGTTYQKELDVIRRRIAMEYLSSTTLPIETISQRLGYINAPSFARAFKRWTTLSASQYRNRYNLF